MVATYSSQHLVTIRFAAPWLRSRHHCAGCILHRTNVWWYGRAPPCAFCVPHCSGSPRRCQVPRVLLLHCLEQRPRRDLGGWGRLHARRNTRVGSCPAAHQLWQHQGCQQFDSSERNMGASLGYREHAVSLDSGLTFSEFGSDPGIPDIRHRRIGPASWPG